MASFVGLVSIDNTSQEQIASHAKMSTVWIAQIHKKGFVKHARKVSL